jgi:hypothetical protein
VKHHVFVVTPAGIGPTGSLPGPSRRITVEPLTVPVSPRPAPPVAPPPETEPAEAPDEVPERVPAP